MSTTHNYFLSAVRQGLAAAITESATGLRAQITVELQAVARKISDQSEDPDTVPQDVQLYGPGDILGFDERIVTRCYPQPDVGDFEPNYFPFIEFADADFAWRFTAAKAEGGDIGRLDPWITLIVLAAEDQGTIVRHEFDDGVQTNQNLPQYICVDLNALPNALPDLEQVWHWAHVHITGEENLSEDDLREILRTQPHRAVCRLLCPRRLAPKVRYEAFVVPTFKLGVLAGRGLPIDANARALDRAWVRGGDNTGLPYYDAGSDRLELPYYYRWEFRTGVRGDFEYLVRLLEPRALSGLGVRNIDCENPGFGTHGVNIEGLEAPERHHLRLEGALQSVDTHYTPWGRDPADQPARAPETLQRDTAPLVNGRYCPFEMEETEAINNIVLSAWPGGSTAKVAWRTPEPSRSHVDYGESDNYGQSKDDAELKTEHELELTELAEAKTYHFRIVAGAADGTIAQTGDGTFEIPELPSVVPPIYGRWHASRGRVHPHDQETWLDVLNLDPRHRVAAGFGSDVVRKQQEALMASAWDQLGAIESANDLLRRAQFGRDTSNFLYERLGHLATEDFLRVTSPAQRRVVPDDQYVTVTEHLRRESLIPGAALDPALRRIMRPRGPIRRRQGAGRSTDLLQRLASGVLEAAGDPPKPLGTTRLCDITRQLRESLERRIDIEPEELDFGTVTVGHSATRLAQIHNVGSADLTVTSITRVTGTSDEFMFIASPSTPFKVSPGGMGAVAVTYLPRNEGMDTGALVIASDDSNRPAVELPLRGEGVIMPQPDIDVDPTAVEFGTVTVGHSATRTAQIHNVGSADLTVTSITKATGTSDEFMFSAPSTPFKVSPGGMGAVAVTYLPRNEGMDTGALVIASDDSNRPAVELPLHGEGVIMPQPDIDVDPTAVEFIDVPLGSSVTMSVTIKNLGSADLNVSEISLALGECFSVSPPAPLRIPSGGSQSVEVTYHQPIGGGTHWDTLVIASDDPDEPTVTVSLSGSPTDAVPETRLLELTEDPWLTFCDRADGFISCEKIQQAIADHAPFDGIENAPDAGETARLVCDTLNEWLDKPPEKPEQLPEPPDDPKAFIEEIKNMVYPALDPNRTVVERVKERLRLTSDLAMHFEDLAMRFEEGARGDPLDSIMWAPEFDQPMYEPLRDISHELLLPGVEKVPQNTLGLLEPNRRFLESYMCGLNHEFAGELLWRKYPTDQRGSYFRQFWDVSGYVARKNDLQQVLETWLAELDQQHDEREINDVADLTREEKIRILRHYMDDRFEKVLERLIERWPEEAGEANLPVWAINRLRLYGLDALPSLEDEILDVLTEELIKLVRLEEKLKDVTHLVRWRNNPLGHNQTRPGEMLVLAIRGDLLKRYPNAIIYAIDAVPEDCENGESAPGLPEYLKCFRKDAQGNSIYDGDGKPVVDEDAVKATLQGIQRIFPVFRAVLPPDLAFFGFPFGEDEARSGSGGRGKYLVIEEPVSEPRFGLDVATDEVSTIQDWDNLSWTHFGFGTQEEEWHYGGYLDDPPDVSGFPVEEWDGASAARRAWITCQRPVRVAVHADQMLPTMVPDLYVESIVTEPRTPPPGEEVEVRVTVRNRGTSATDAFFIDWYPHLDQFPSLDDEGEQREQVQSLAPGARYTMTIHHMYSAPGEYHMYAQVDREQNIAEYIEGNNVHGPVIVRVINPIDLYVEDITVEPRRPFPGEEAEVTVTVTNRGTSATDAFFIDWYPHLDQPPSLDDEGEQREQVQSLAPGASYTMTVHYTYAAPGEYRMYAQVDREQEIAEYLEGNNVYGPWTVQVR